MLCSATPPTSPLPWLSLLPLSPSLELVSQRLAGCCSGVCDAREAAQPLCELWEVLVLFLCAFPGWVHPPMGL